MPKLVVNLDISFEVGPPLVYDSAIFKNRPLRKAELKKILSTAQKSEFGIDVVLLDPEEKWPLVGFNLMPISKDEDVIFEWNFDMSAKRASVKVRGEMVSNALRPGVTQEIRSLGKEADFRLAGLCLRGGEYDGFRAPVADQDPTNINGWIRVENWKLK